MNKTTINNLKKEMPNFESDLESEKSKTLANYKARIKNYTDVIYPKLSEMLVAVKAMDDTDNIDIYNCKRIGTGYRVRLIKSEKQITADMEQAEKEVEVIFAERITALQESWIGEMLEAEAQEKAVDAALQQQKKYDDLKAQILSEL